MPATDPPGKKLVLVVIDGLTPKTFERAVDDGRAPTLGLLAANGRYRRSVTTFPSLTPVCLSSLVTGAHPDVHGIPHLVWYHRGERRVVEYGSSFGAIRAAGTRRSIRDAIVEMNATHLSGRAVTVFEALEDAGLRAAAVNITCYRGRTLYRPSVPGLARPVLAPSRFFYYGLYESARTGAPLAIRNRARGSTDEYAAAVGRWLVTRDGFDFLAYYLSDFDFASHAAGPDAADDALARSDRAVGALIEAAGGADEFLARYAVVVCSDHGQTPVRQTVALESRVAGIDGVLVTASNRAGMLYRSASCRQGTRELALRLDGEPSADSVLFLEEDGWAVLRRDGEELRFAGTPDGSWVTDGDAALMEHPDGLARSWGALNNPQAGEILVSAAPGYEFADLGGRHHAGGGSHGSLVAGDSEVPMLTVGIDALPGSITGIAPLVLAHFGVEPPSYARPLLRAA